MLLYCPGVLASNTQENNGTQVSTGDSTILARVNGESITEAQVLRRLQAVHGDLEPHRQQPNRWQRMLEAGIDAELHDRLLLQAAVAAKLKVTPEEVIASRKRTKEILGEAPFLKMLSSRGATKQDYDAFLRKRLLINNYKDRLFSEISLDEATLRAYYEGHKELFTLPRRVEVETLAVKDRELAQAIYKELKAGSDFQEAVSQKKAESDGGMVVTMNRVVIDDLPTNIRKLVESAKPGDVLEPVDDFGKVRLIKIHATKPAQTLTFEKAKPEIESSLLNKRQQAILEDWFEQTRKKANIEYYPRQRSGH